MNKSELVAAIAEKSGLTKDQASKALNAFEVTLTETLKSGGELALVGFGTFKVTDRAERNGRNPKTGETIVIKASKVPSFKAGKGLKDAVNE